MLNTRKQQSAPETYSATRCKTLLLVVYLNRRHQPPGEAGANKNIFTVPLLTSAPWLAPHAGAAIDAATPARLK